MNFKCKCGSTMVALAYDTEIDRWVMIEPGDKFPDTSENIKWAVNDVRRLCRAQCEECITSWVGSSLEELIEIMQKMEVLK